MSKPFETPSENTPPKPSKKKVENNTKPAGNAKKMQEKITPSDLRKQAEELIRSGQMPRFDEFMKVMTEARDKYVQEVKKLREKDKKK